jgi:hypothetical protein
MNQRMLLRGAIVILALSGVLVLASGLLVHASEASALLTASNTLTNWSVDGGGGSSSGSGYTITGTLGQPDAGVLTGNSYTLTGGFWGGVPANSPIFVPIAQR